MKKKEKISINSKIIIIILSVLLLISLVINIYLFSIKKNINLLDENIVFFGDSITSGYKIEEFYPKNNVINSGTGGDTTENLLERMNDVCKYNPSKVFILIGINDLNRGKSIDEILDNIQRIVNNIKTNREYTNIYIESVYPINRNVFVAINMSSNKKVILNICVDKNDRSADYMTEENLKLALGQVLLNEQRAGHIYVKYEYKQACFHITSRR